MRAFLEIVESPQESVGCLLQIFWREELSHLSGRHVVLVKVLTANQRQQRLHCVALGSKLQLQLKLLLLLLLDLAVNGW